MRQWCRRRVVKSSHWSTEAVGMTADIFPHLQLNCHSFAPGNEKWNDDSHDGSFSCYFEWLEPLYPGKLICLTYWLFFHSSLPFLAPSHMQHFTIRCKVNRILSDHSPALTFYTITFLSLLNMNVFITIHDFSTTLHRDEGWFHFTVFMSPINSRVNTAKHKFV